MLKILSFDPGMTSLGWAFSEYEESTGKFNVLKFGTLKPIKTASKLKEMCNLFGQRIVTAVTLEDEINELIKSVKPDGIVTEDAFYHPGRPTAYISLSICIHSIERAAYANKKTLTKIPPRAIKFTVCGSGAGGKLAIQEAIASNPNIIFKKDIDTMLIQEHEADAIGCGYTFCINTSY